jgi:hypothetical protein
MERSARRWRITGCAIGAAFAMSFSPSARAQSAKASAEALFAEGRRLMGEGKLDEACPKFADSQKLDPSSGTLLNLGNCYEKLGKNASAWASYQEAASLASSAGRADHLSVAQKRAAALQPTLAHVTVSVPQPVPGLEIKRDGVPVLKAEWGLSVPMDAGAHMYVAEAPRHKSVTLKIVVAKTDEGQPGAKVTVTIPALEALPADALPVTTGAAGPDRPRDEGWPGQRTAALVVGGVGLVGLGLGAVFTVMAKSKYDASLESCRPTDPTLCTQAGVDERDGARTFGNVATVGYVAGGALAAAGVVLWFTAPSGSSAPKSASMSMSPLFDAAGHPGGLRVKAAW